MKINDTTETKYYTYDFKDNYVMIEKRSFSQPQHSAQVTRLPIPTRVVNSFWFD